MIKKTKLKKKKLLQKKYYHLVYDMGKDKDFEKTKVIDFIFHYPTGETTSVRVYNPLFDYGDK